MCLNFQKNFGLKSKHSLKLSYVLLYTFNDGGSFKCPIFTLDLERLL